MNIYKAQTNFLKQDISYLGISDLLIKQPLKVYIIIEIWKFVQVRNVEMYRSEMWKYTCQEYGIAPVGNVEIYLSKI